MSVAIQFRVLGAVEARVGGRAVDLGPERQRCVLAALLVDANHVVPVEQLLSRVWNGELSHRATLYSYVSRLRTALGGQAHIAIVRQSGGYLLAVDLLAVDLHLFHHLVGLARRAPSAEQAVEHFDQGLGLWRGEAFAGLDTQWLNQVRRSIDAERRAVELDRNDLMLRLGRHADVLAELTSSVAAHPLDERRASQLMLGLHRAGRRAEALQVYQDTRSALVNELGLDPGPDLQRLHQRILSDDVGPATGSGAHAERAATPRQIPADIPHFTGRDRHLARLRAQFEQLQRTNSPAAMIAAISGTSGVGKTALAVRFGHDVLDRMPDGQLYLDLRGHAPTQPMTAVEALGRLLRGLGVPPGGMPTDEQELAATYRSLLAGRRVLIMLDNARTAAQVRPLLPGTPGCVVVITSRTILSTLDNVVQVHLEVLSEPDALGLFTRLAGRERVDQDREAASDVVRMCAGLPLALRIAAARLAARPSWPVATLAARLADEQRRLEELSVGDQAVRTGFAVSYRASLTSDDPVDRAAARAFRLLGALHWVDMTVPVAAALLDVEPSRAQDALERLVDDQLLDSEAPGRYRTHDLLRLYARDVAQQDEPEHDRDEALSRVLHCYLDAADRANLLLNPFSRHRNGAPSPWLGSRFSLDTNAEATAWTEAEQENLVAVSRQALDAAGDRATLAVRLTAALNRPFDLLGYWHGFVIVRELAAGTAARLGDRLGSAFAMQDTAWTYVRLGRSEQAITTARRALAVWREVGDRRSEQACLNILGFALRQLARYDEALDCLEEAFTICWEIEHRYGQASTLNHLGLVYQHLGRFDDAVVRHTRALAINRQLDDGSGQAIALANLGWAYQRAGLLDDAVDHYHRSLALTRDANDRYQEAETLWGLGQTHHALGEHDHARVHWNKSIAILRDIGAVSDEQASVLSRRAVPDTPEIILRST